jgi:hypothetical protein
MPSLEKSLDPVDNLIALRNMASMQNSISLEPIDHFTRIALCAYFKAEARGFSPGHELDDWLAAEAEIAT